MITVIQKQTFFYEKSIVIEFLMIQKMYLYLALVFSFYFAECIVFKKKNDQIV